MKRHQFFVLSLQENQINKSLSCLTSLILGGVLLFSILTIHTVLLKERTRIEGIEQQIISQEGIQTTRHDSFYMTHVI